MSKKRKLDLKPCRKCGSKDISESRVKEQNYLCRACEREYNTEYRNKNKAQLKKQRQERNKKKYITLSDKFPNTKLDVVG